MSWLAYAAMFGLFLISHSLPTRPGIKRRAVARIGTRGFTILYSLLSLAMLLMLIRAATWPEPIFLWPQTPLTRTVTRIGMLGVCLIFALAIGRPNPFSFGGAKNERFDPAQPGIVRLHRHPLLLGLALWAGLHLLPNGDLAHVVLFGPLGGFALLGMRLIDRRRQKEIGREAWQALRAQTRRAPLLTVLQGGDLKRCVLGGLAYCGLVLTHSYIAGISVL